MKTLLLLLPLAFGGQSADLDEQLRAEIRAKRYLSAEKLLSNPDVNPDSRDAEGWTALMYASRTDDPHLVKLLLKAKVDLEIANRQGETALLVAARRGNVEAARQLLMAGADVSARDARGRTALDWAEAENRTYLSQIIRIASRPSISKVTVAEKPVDVGAGPMVPRG